MLAATAENGTIPIEPQRLPFKKHCPITAIVKKTRRTAKPKPPHGSARSWDGVLLAELPPEAVRAIEWAVFAVACVAAVWLNVSLLVHSGAFWRDECSTILVAQSPGWSDLWRALPNDSFPVLFAGLLRLWILSGLGATDVGIRVLGFLIGLGIPAAAFFCCRTFSRRPPLLAVSLLAVCPTTFYFGSSMRAYGLAAIVALLCLAAFWRLVEHPTRRNAVIATVLAVLNVQACYQNSYLLFGIGVAGAVACLFRRRWKLAVLILAIGGLAACSLVPYGSIIAQYRTANELAFSDFHLETVGGKFADALAGGPNALLAVWTLLLGTAALSACLHVVRDGVRGVASPAFYVLVAAVVSGLTGFAFMTINAMSPFEWHYAPLIALLAVDVDVGLEPLNANAWVQQSRIAAAGMVLVLGFLPASAMSHLRRTNVDLACQAIASRAESSDLVLAIPPYIAPSVCHYDHGSAPWTTIPMAGRGQCTSSPAIRQRMATPDAIRPTLQTIQDYLQAGRRVWIVRNHPQETLTSAPPSPPPITARSSGWNQDRCIDAWIKQIDYVLQTHAVNVSGNLLPTGEPVHPLENVTVYRIEGWRAR
ncbi:MAG: hypothetical protein ABFC77_09960 [Thermoguttaceae bacterium]